MCYGSFINMAHTQFVKQFFCLAGAVVVAVRENSRDFVHGLHSMSLLNTCLITWGVFSDLKPKTYFHSFHRGCLFGRKELQWKQKEKRSIFNAMSTTTQIPFTAIILVWRQKSYREVHSHLLSVQIICMAHERLVRKCVIWVSQAIKFALYNYLREGGYVFG